MDNPSEEVRMRRRVGLVPKIALLAFAAASAFVALAVLDDWVGNWVGPVWLLCTYLLPFLLGVGLGAAAPGMRGVLAGGVAGGAMVGVPLLFLALVSDLESLEETGDQALAILAVSLISLAVVMGALGLSMGVAVRLRRFAP